MDWDYTEHMKHISRAPTSQGTDPDGCPDSSLEAWYRYDAGKQRTRKRVKKQGGLLEERFYLGGLEWYRRTRNGALIEELETLHVFDGDQRLLMVDQILETDRPALGIRTLYRYTLSNHLGSSTLELDEQAEIISYEEYHPYGTTAYQSGRNAVEVTLKRYRYTGMERDEESGLSYHTARYYVPWLARWLSCDPVGLAGSANAYGFVTENPVNLVDPNGAAPVPARAVELMNDVINRLTGAGQHLDRGSNEVLLLEAQNGGMVNTREGRYFTHIEAAQADVGRARELSERIRTYVGQTAGLSEDAVANLRFASARLEQAAATTETTIAAAELLRSNTEWAIRFNGQTFKTGRLVSEQLAEMAANHGAQATLLPESTLFEGVLDQIGNLARRGTNPAGINFYSGVPFIQEFFESAAWEKIANKGESAVRWGSVKLAGVLEVTAKLARYVQYGLAIHGGESAVKSLMSPEANQRLNVYFTARDAPGDVELLLFQGAATGVGLLDALAVDIKAGVGDWDYGTYAAEVYMQKGMSPAQRDFTEWARVEFGMVPDRR
jgi:RHS repeat-associated protein